MIERLEGILDYVSPGDRKKYGSDTEQHNEYVTQGALIISKLNEVIDVVNELQSTSFTTKNTTVEVVSTSVSPDATYSIGFSKPTSAPEEPTREQRLEQLDKVISLSSPFFLSGHAQWQQELERLREMM